MQSLFAFASAPATAATREGHWHVVHEVHGESVLSPSQSDKFGGADGRGERIFEVGAKLQRSGRLTKHLRSRSQGLFGGGSRRMRRGLDWDDGGSCTSIGAELAHSQHGSGCVLGRRGLEGREQLVMGWERGPARASWRRGRERKSGGEAGGEGRRGQERARARVRGQERRREGQLWLRGSTGSCLRWTGVMSLVPLIWIARNFHTATAERACAQNVGGILETGRSPPAVGPA